MKKLSLFMFLGLAAWIFQSCNGNGSENNADSTNEARSDSGNLNVKESAADFMVDAANINMTEIKVGQLAQQKSNNQRIKDFGNMLVNDHSQAQNELTTLAANKNVSLPDSVNQDSQDAYNKLQGESGDDFDQDFISDMVNGHQKAINKFEDQTDAQDQDLSSWVGKTLPVLHKHLDTAQAIQNEMQNQ